MTMKKMKSANWMQMISRMQKRQQKLTMKKQLTALRQLPGTMMKRKMLWIEELEAYMEALEKMVGISVLPSFWWLCDRSIPISPSVFPCFFAPFFVFLPLPHALLSSFSFCWPCVSCWVRCFILILCGYHSFFYCLIAEDPSRRSNSNRSWRSVWFSSCADWWNCLFCRIVFKVSSCFGFYCQTLLFVLFHDWFSPSWFLACVSSFSLSLSAFAHREGIMYQQWLNSLSPEQQSAITALALEANKRKVEEEQERRKEQQEWFLYWLDSLFPRLRHRQFG